MTKEKRIVDAFVEIMKDYMATQDDDRFDASEQLYSLYEDCLHLYGEIIKNK